MLLRPNRRLIVPISLERRRNTTILVRLLQSPTPRQERVGHFSRRLRLKVVICTIAEPDLGVGLDSMAIYKPLAQLVHQQCPPNNRRVIVGMGKAVIPLPPLISPQNILQEAPVMEPNLVVIGMDALSMKL